MRIRFVYVNAEIDTTDTAPDTDVDDSGSAGDGAAALFQALGGAAGEMLYTFRHQLREALDILEEERMDAAEREDWERQQRRQQRRRSDVLEAETATAAEVLGKPVTCALFSVGGIERVVVGTVVSVGASDRHEVDVEVVGKKGELLERLFEVRRDDGTTEPGWAWREIRHSEKADTSPSEEKPAEASPSEETREETPPASSEEKPAAAEKPPKKSRVRRD